MDGLFVDPCEHLFQYTFPQTLWASTIKYSHDPLNPAYIGLVGVFLGGLISFLAQFYVERNRQKIASKTKQKEQGVEIIKLVIKDVEILDHIVTQITTDNESSVWQLTQVENMKSIIAGLNTASICANIICYFPTLKKQLNQYTTSLGSLLAFMQIDSKQSHIIDRLGNSETLYQLNFNLQENKKHLIEKIISNL